MIFSIPFIPADKKFTAKRAAMMKFFFTLGDLLTSLVPFPRWRENLRVVQLYDFRRKYRALRHAFPNMPFGHVKMVKGGWNIGFIVDRKYVFKIRKSFDGGARVDKIIREKRITDAFSGISPIAIPNIDIIESDGLTFYKYDFIPGQNLNRFSRRTIMRHREKWGRQIARFIHAVHTSDPAEIGDLKSGDGDGWNHNDICNNIIVNPKTMDIVGLIDWEYSGWGTLQTEFDNTVAFSHAMRQSGIQDVVIREYKKLTKD